MEDLKKLIFRQTGPNQLSGRKHVHPDEYELLYVSQGSGRVMIGAGLFPLTPNTLYIINGEDVHFVSPDNKTEYVRTIINLPKEYLHGLFAAAKETDALPKLLQKGAVCLGSAAAEAVETALFTFDNAEEHKNLSFACALFTLFSACAAADSQVSPYSDGIIASVLSYIDENITEKITLEDIEKHTFVSKYHICHKFKKTVGMTPGEYILKRRISLTKKLLSGSDFALSEIAMSAGFGSFSYFSSSFKRSEGITPIEYRRRYQNDSLHRQ